jgi:hydroxyacylglutathione hydrolase
MKNTELAQRITANSAPQVIDARSGFEFKRGHVPGAIHAPVLTILFKRACLPENKNAELVITCEHGPRAMMAKRLLAIYGYRNTTLLDGHMLGWRRAGLPLEKQLS